MIEVRPMRPEDTAQVRALYERVHPYPTPRSDQEWSKYQIIVALDGRWDRDPATWTQVVGYTAADLSTPGVLVGVETLVSPEHQGQGIGRRLMEARLAAGADRIFVGAAALDNAPMRHLLTSQGMVEREECTYPNGQKGMIYASKF